MDDTAEEDAVADAAGDGKTDAPTFPLGIYSSFNVDHEKDEALHAAFHQDGSADFTKFTSDYETRYTQGFFKAYQYQGRNRVRITDADGKVILRADWKLDADGDLTFAGESWLKTTRDTDYVVNCTAFEVSDTNLFEESFTEYEYPSLDVTADDVSIGSSSLDSTEGTIKITEGPRQLVVTHTRTDGPKVEISVQNEPPRRGLVKYAEEPTGTLGEMARIICP